MMLPVGWDGQCGKMLQLFAVDAGSEGIGFVQTSFAFDRKNHYVLEKKTIIIRLSHPLEKRDH